MQLGIEHPVMATMYKNKSIAEQNSINACRELLMSPDFAGLLGLIYATKEILTRFRHLIINVVSPPTSSTLARWVNAFAEPTAQPIDQEKDNSSNLKATIVIEHVIQASDVSHTMPHWHIYRAWNERLLCKMYQGIQSRSDGQTSRHVLGARRDWILRQNYIIQLAMKLSDCKVFGISSDEYLNYARHNRDEWAQKDPQLVAEMVEMYFREDKSFNGLGDIVEQQANM